MTKNNYKRLGDFIQRVDVRNTENEDLPLMGLSIEKKFIPSIANTIGTDMRTYRVIKSNHFAYGPVTSRNGEKITIALFSDYDRALISQAYVPFEIIDNNLLEPQYLMMWFRRPEFDRYARFKSHGSARETFDWDEMCDVELPVPTIEKQREIVQEYQVVEKRIALNEQLIAKLEETAQAVYREWFVEFEFPDEDGKPYKSNGGKMVWNEELEKDVPEGWEVVKLEEIIENFDSKRIPLSGLDRATQKKIYPYYGAASLMDYVEDYIFDGTFILLGEDGTVMNEDGSPVLQYVWGKFWVNNHAHVLQGRNGFNEDSLYLLLKNINVSDIITGAVQHKINQGNLNSVSVIRSNNIILGGFNDKIQSLFSLLRTKRTEIQNLEELKDLLLTRMVK